MGHAQGMGAVPFGLVEHHDRLLVVGQLTAEIVEKQTYRLGQDDRHDKREASAIGWPHGAKQMNSCLSDYTALAEAGCTSTNDGKRGPSGRCGLCPRVTR